MHGFGRRRHLSQRIDLFNATRSCITEIIKLLEQHQIHATWAIVGHLFLDECQAVGCIKHPEIIRPQYHWHSNDWFTCDPCTNLVKDPLWYGSDIVRQILSCKVKQEIGCHTFSHVIVGDAGCSSSCFNSELHACLQAASKLEINLRSFVFS
jgi:peptidoglycan/xylan/chitin deacetylase (PgdA/CDA1 family)